MGTNTGRDFLNEMYGLQSRDWLVRYEREKGHTHYQCEVYTDNPFKTLIGVDVATRPTFAAYIISDIVPRYGTGPHVAEILFRAFCNHNPEWAEHYHARKRAEGWAERLHDPVFQAYAIGGAQTVKSALDVTRRLHMEDKPKAMVGLRRLMDAWPSRNKAYSDKSPQFYDYLLHIVATTEG